MTEMTNEQLLSLADLMVEQGSTFETPKYFSRLVELARIGASVMPRPIALDDLRLWNSDVTTARGELTLQFDNAQDADKMCDFLLALTEIKHAITKPQVKP